MPELPKSDNTVILGALPEVQLEVRQGSRAAPYSFSHVDFLIGTVPGCDLRVPGADLPAVLCILARHPGGVKLRKLAPTQLLLVNGNTVSSAELVDGDRITLGAIDLYVHLQMPEKAPSPETGVPRELGTPIDKTLDLERQRQELANQRQELVQIRRELYERYQERRDRLAGLQEAVDRAARKVQERKRLLEADAQALDQRQQADAERQAELLRRAAEIETTARQLEDERRAWSAGQGKSLADLESKIADLAKREESLANEHRNMDARLSQYQADLVRLDRLQGAIEQRDQDLVGKEEACAKKLAQLQADSAELEAEALRLDALRAEFNEQNDRLASQKAEQDAAEHQLVQRAAALEGQQATLTSLRTRLERMREEVRQGEQELAKERQRQQQTKQEVAEDRQTLERQRQELAAEDSAREQERAALLERSAVLEAAVANLKQAQLKLTDEEARLEDRSRAIEERQRIHTENESILLSRLRQLAETQERLDSERNALRERTQALADAEKAREALQEQLRRRGEELAQRQKSVDDKLQAIEARNTDLDSRQFELDRQQQEALTRLGQASFELERNAESIAARHAELAQKENHQRHQFEQLQTLGKEIAGQRKALAQDRLALQLEQQAAAEAQTAAYTEFELMRKEAVDLQRRLPDLELHAGTTLERLTHAREQLRDHLAELHSYVHACQDDLDQLRGRIQKDEAGLQNHEQALRHSQEEHRLAVVAFRQQLISWQGQIGDMKRLLASDETRLERKEAQVAEQVKELDETTEKLARQAEELQERQEEVAGRRVEMDRHLVDMRDWYRKKLRELAGIDLAHEVSEADLVDDDGIVPIPWKDSQPVHQKSSDSNDEEALVPIGRNILSMTEPVDPGDRHLGETLAQLELVDRETLTALLVEARRQRRSLRQVLLAGGVITVYQLALIEAGQMERLMLGPVRVIDRLRVARSETTYRVYDPRRGEEAVLRHLSDEELQNAAHAEEYTQRFSEAMLDDANLARTLEVLDIAGRPAVLQEWLCGLPSSDWPPLAAAPGVCFRLLTQAALALAAIHKAGFAHGHLSDMSLFLTGEGLLKITGLGEPPWLCGVEEQTDPIGDLRALGRIVSGWCTPTGVRKGAKAKPLPDSLVSVLYRLNAEGKTGYQSASELLTDLDQAGADIPANAEAWDRLLRYIKEHGTPEALLRQSA